MAPSQPPHERWRLRLRGAVQGVGFRPFVFRLASELELVGYVSNDPAGVTVEVEGDRARLELLAHRVVSDAPPAARPELVSSVGVPPVGDGVFEIRESPTGGTKSAVLLPDLATCPDCRAEVFDPGDRRHRYPFTNCTNCGPRFSIIRSLPYDRPRTTMSGFAMCARCRREYVDPHDRRFHAQPNACPECGPGLTLTDASGQPVARLDAALHAAANAIRSGLVLGLKGLGGFHLLVDAANSPAVQRLRERKARWEKPLAVMAPSLEMAATLVELNPEARRLLTSPASPILLLPRRANAPVADEVAPGNPQLGVMLPYTPLHQLLLAHLDRIVVATSGNRTDEPICITEAEAHERLGTIADLLLVHDRPIERQVDDSVVTFVAGAPQLVRRSRGYAPAPLRLGTSVPPILAVGPHLKNTVALAIGDEVFVGQHVGDLKNTEAAAAHERIVRDFVELYDASPVAIAHDLHPDYHSTQWLERLRSEPAPSEWQRRLASARFVPVQHHHAHLAALLAEHRIDEPTLGVTWDGTGWGTDGTIWGGEFLLGNAASYERVGHLRPFRLPGGDAAIKEPRRSALALLAAAGLLDAARGSAALAAFAPAERRVLEEMLVRQVNCPVTTSAGRLFDGVAALAGIRQRAAYEGQAAMELEWVARDRDEGEAPDPYPMPILDGQQGLVLDWQPLVEELLAEVRASGPSSRISARFHETLARSIVAVANRIGNPRVALTGGCFQNRRLTERAKMLLEVAGFTVLIHRQVPPNDGGVSLGQVAVAAAALVR
jgi:hydrogenase maturation protein HypF